MNSSKLVQVYLFSESDEDTGYVTPLQYSMSKYSVEDMDKDIQNKVRLIRFGESYHHIDDIIKIVVI